MSHVESTTSALLTFFLHVLALLRSKKRCTIQEISDHLGFPDQATFSKFFKKHTGYSPTEYRLR